MKIQHFLNIFLVFANIFKVHDFNISMQLHRLFQALETIVVNSHTQVSVAVN